MLTKCLAVIMTAIIAIPVLLRVATVNAGNCNDETTLVSTLVVEESSESVEETQEVETTSVSEEVESTVVEEESETTVEETSEEIFSDDIVEYLGTYTLTAYCPCYECSEGYGHHTSSGAWATEGRTVACNSIPAGTRLVINGHEYVVEDTGGGLGSSKIDIFFECHEDTEEFGLQKADVYIVR